MPKQLLAAVQIHIDTQEQRSSIPAIVAAMPQCILRWPLCAWATMTWRRSTPVFERKTGATSLAVSRGRLFAQLTALRKAAACLSYCWRETRCASATPRCA